MVALACVLPATTRAEDKSGVSPSKLTLPKGPGSIGGIGENAEPNINMGLVSYGVPVDLPSGYGGFGPSLRLSYSSGSGNSEVGMGWSLAVPRIKRMTSKGLPSYGPDDLFAANGGDELVHLPGSNIYRARYEGGFVRYRYLDPAGQGRFGYWKAEYPDGRVGFFGADVSGASEPLARIQGDDGTFAYYLVEMQDVHGHSVRYSYTQEEHQPYLSSISWVFRGDDPRYQVALDYEARQDALVDGKPGFSTVLGKRLTGVRVLVEGTLLRRYELSYEPYARSGGLSRLAAVTTYGTDNATVYPVVFSFAYTGSFDPTCSEQEQCNLPFVHTLGGVGVDFHTNLADLVDITGDGLADVVDTTGGVHSLHVNTISQAGGHTLAAPVRSVVATGGSCLLSSAHVHMVDLDGDGFSDMVDGLNDRVLWNHGLGDWESETFAETGLPDFAADANLRFFDYNHDRAVDVMHSDGSNTWYYLNNGDGSFASTAIEGEALGWGFVSHGAKLADMNGDGMQDLTLPLLGSVAYKPNLGLGRFGPVVDMFGLPSDLAAADMNPVDINGDGLADVVVVLGNEVRYALNRNGEDFADMVTLQTVDGGSIPERTSEVSVRFADMNGTGSTDVVWISASGEITYLEVFPRRPNLLSRIENGIGKVIELHYSDSTEQMALDGGPGAWTYRLPHVSQVLSRIETYDTLSEIRQIQELRYHNGYYDGEEKQFRGFINVELLAAGDPHMEAGEAEHVFEVGQHDPYRKGLLLSKRVLSGARVLSESRSTYEDCPVWGIPASVAGEVRSICQTGSEQTLIEGTAESEWVVVREATDYDGYGNQTKVAKLGDTTSEGDEQYEETEYVSPSHTGGRWLLRAPFRKRTYGDASGPYTEELTFYDGEDFEGLPLGELTRGLPTRVTQRITDDEVIDAARTGYDQHGNPTIVMDPNGHLRRLEYDVDSLLPVAEVLVFDDPSHPAYELRMELGYDLLLEKPVESTAWMRIEAGENQSSRRSTSYDYDVFGRLTAIAEPNDSLDAPTHAFSYELEDPVSRIVQTARSIPGEPADIEAAQCFDGLGRGIQQRQKVGSERYLVSGYVQFNIQGKEARVYQPYEGSSSACDTQEPADVLFAETFFDSTGRPIEVITPDETLYGSASRAETRYGPLWTESWDAEDNDPESSHSSTPSRVRVDGLGRTVAMEALLEAHGEPAITRISYDSLGRLQSYVDAAGNRKSHSYDLLGRMVQIEDPNAGTLRFAYDAAGNVTRSTDARGEVARQAYDEANRPTSKWHEDDAVGSRVYYFYDRATDVLGCPACTHPEGQLVGISYPIGDGSRGYDLLGYDERGRSEYSARELGGVLFEFQSHFDNADRLAGTTYPDDRRIDTVLDPAGRVTQVPGFVDLVTYTSQGDLDSFLLNNGTRTEYSYDVLQRLESIRTRGPSGEELQDLQYTRDRVSNLVEIFDDRPPDGSARATAELSYDAWYRLSSVALEDETLSFAYDSINNILSKRSSRGFASKAHVGAYHYGEHGAGPYAVTSTELGFYEYDAAGNMTLHGREAYEWDYLGRLREARLGPKRLAWFGYGADRERVVKKEGAHRTYYVAPDFEVRDGIAITYVRIGGNRVAKLESDALAAELLPDAAPEDGLITASDAYQAIASGASQEEVDLLLAAAVRRTVHDGVTFLHHNHQGTTTATTDAHGELLQRTEHYPYGEVRYQSGFLEDYSYTGQERDQATSLSYHGARYYEPRLGRWTSPDPLFLLDPKKGVESPLKCNLYSYAADNPVASVDPDGLDPIPATAPRILNEGLEGSTPLSAEDRNREFKKRWPQEEKNIVHFRVMRDAADEGSWDAERYQDLMNRYFERDRQDFERVSAVLADAEKWVSFISTLESDTRHNGRAWAKALQTLRRGDPSLIDLYKTIRSDLITVAESITGRLPVGGGIKPSNAPTTNLQAEFEWLPDAYREYLYPTRREYDFARVEPPRSVGGWGFISYKKLPDIP